MEKTARIDVKMPPSLLAEFLETVRRQKEDSVSATIRKLIKEYIKKEAHNPVITE